MTGRLEDMEARLAAAERTVELLCARLHVSVCMACDGRGEVKRWGRHHDECRNSEPCAACDGHGLREDADA